MKLRTTLFTAVSLWLCGQPGVSLAQSGNWNAYQNKGVGTSRFAAPQTSQPEETRTWNQEVLTLETRPMAALLSQGYAPASVSLNYLSGNTEIYLSKPDGRPSLILCTLRTQAGGSDNKLTIATRCMAFN